VVSHGLHRSPLVDLVASYAKAARARAATRADGAGGLALDLSSPTHPGPLDALIPGSKVARTDVVLVMLESVGAPHTDGAETPMPFLASLAERPGAVVFERHYTTWCLTTKAFFSVFCSEVPYPTYVPITQINPAIPCVSLTQALSKAGFETAFITSQSLAWDQQMRFFRHRALDLVWDMHSQPGHASAWKSGWAVDDRLTVANALALIAQPRKKPLFLLVNLGAGHHPYEALPEHVDRPLPTRREAYRRAIGTADARLHDLVEGLELAGRLATTLLLVASDHGEGVEGPPERRGRNVYEDSARVPMLLLGPQFEGEPRRIGEVTSHLDLAPTLLGLVGVPVPCTMRGRELTKPSARTLAYVGGRPPRFQLGIVDERYKLILEEDGEHALFDLEADPDEARDVAAAHPDVARTLLDRLETLRGGSEQIIEDYAARLAASGCRP
jgi:arylsulfatase A-like enzyme